MAEQEVQYDDYDLNDLDPHGIGESPFSEKEVKKFKDVLVAERQKVLARMGNHVTQATEDHDNLADEMDLATRHSDQAFLLRLADKEHKLLSQINRALAKIQAGVYGLCEGTGDPIEKRRLELRPWTRYGLEHKEQLEKEQRNRKYR